MVISYCHGRPPQEPNLHYDGAVTPLDARLSHPRLVGPLELVSRAFPGPQLPLAALGSSPLAARGLRAISGWRSKLPTNQRIFISPSERYRACAEECRRQAQTFREKKAQAQMFRLAADYERRAMQAETFEPKPGGRFRN